MGSNWELPYPTSTVDKIEQLGDAELSFEKIQKKHGTFRTYSNGTDRLGKKKYRSRVGVQTDCGDIEITLWCELVHKLIDEHNEQELFNHLKVWVMNNCKWLTDKQDIERETLELHASRIFDNPCWIGYMAFNQKYRPEILEGADLVWAINQNHPIPQRIPREKMERDNATSSHCYICGEWREVKNPKGGAKNAN